MKILKESIELDTPYMLRNDGKLISCKDLLIHPYINKLPTSVKNIKAAYEFLLANDELNNYKWFYQYSSNLETKEILKKLIDNNFEINELNSLLIKLSFLTNQEFCRVRTSGKFLGVAGNSSIYFRISSFGFNWFGLIWTIVNNNKNIIDTVTVCTDLKSKGYDNYYKYHGIELNNLPVEDFITLSGNPIIEKVIDIDKATTDLMEELDLC